MQLAAYDNPSETLPLTQGQLGIWLAQMLDPEDASYNIGECIEIHGSFDSLSFERALRDVVASSDALHLKFFEAETGPAQYFDHELNWPLVKKDFSAELNPEQIARAWMQKDMRRPFRLYRTMLYRSALFRLSEHHHIWYGVHHHLINDGSGGRLLVKRVAEAYTALVSDAELPAPSVTSWREVVAEETSYKTSARRDRDRAFWKSQLANYPSPVTLSGKTPSRNSGYLTSTCYIPHRIDFASLARRHNATPAAVMAAATAIFLNRMTGKNDLVIGVPVANRVTASARSTIGMVSNVLPLRLAVEPHSDIGEIVESVGRSMRGAIWHQRYRIEDLRHDLGLVASDPDICGTYVNVVPVDETIAFNGSPVVSDHLGNWRVDDLHIVYLGGDHEDGVRVDFIANPAHYDPEELEAHTGRFVRVVQQLASATADMRVSEIDVLTRSEREAVLLEWNDTTRAISAATVADLFHEQVQKESTSPALVSSAGTWSYGDLNAQANRIAQALLVRGIGMGDRIALAVPRSCEAVAALVAVLKVGAVYVPIDPGYPAARIALILEDCRPRLLVAVRETAQIAAAGIEVLVLDDEAVLEELGHYDASINPKAEGLGPASPASIIYTSGSTGSPKGVVGLHRGLVNRLQWMAASFPFHESGPTLARTSLSFVDGSTELLGPLTAGGPVVLAAPEAANDPRALADLIETHAIGRVSVVPSMLAAILENVDPARLASCKLWIVSGAQMTPRLSALFHARLPGRRLLNLYGTTEASGDSLHAFCKADDCPIGRPIWNTQAYILNDNFEPVPVGATGELFIAGAGLAAGYFGADELSAERFIEVSIGEAVALIYRTGDRARWRADGMIEFLGRADHQVNLNGIRVELREIETALESCPGVREAAVVVREGEESAGQLVAFVTPQRESDAPGGALIRQHLAKLLPEAVVPSLFETLVTMPLLPNGKIDRQVLAAKAIRISPEGAAKGAPLRTPTEVLLGEIWSEVLRRPVLDRNADFFVLGGDSLRAIQVMSRVKGLFNVDLQLISAFEARTLERLAKMIDTASGSGRSSARLPAIRRMPTGKPSPLSSSQERMWTIQSLEPDNTAYNIVSAYRITNSLDIDAIEQAIGRLFQRHEILRTTYSMVDGEVVQIVQPSSRDVLDILTIEGDDASEGAIRLANGIVRIPFDLAKGPIAKCALIRVSTVEHVLVVAMHHIAGDQWSAGVIGRELVALYEGYSSGDPIEMDEPNLQYRDYAAWQRDFLDGAEIARQRDFWIETLKDLPPLELPVDKLRPRMQTMHGAVVTADFEPALQQDLEVLARRESATQFMTMMAGFAALLSRISDQFDIAIGVPVANRSLDAVEQMVGTFVNFIVLRIDLTGNPTFRELVARVRAASLEAFAHQDLPFDQLVQELVGTRDTSRAPLAQVLFNVQNAPMHGIEANGLKLEPLILDRAGAQFELGMSVDSQISRLVTVEYNTDLFEHVTIERFVARYLGLLSQAVADPTTRLDAFDLLLEAEREQLDGVWNATTVEKSDAPFIRMFEQRVAERPDAPALTIGDITVSYADLDRRANALAQAIVAAGVGHGDKVGVCVERSVTMVAALLAVQKSGGAYVPLDPELPAERLEFMVADSEMGVLIASDRTRDRISSTDGIIVINTDQPFDTAASGEAMPPARPIASTDPVYVIYTSGSTGRPKGVEVPHGALANFLTSMQHTPGLTENDVLAAVTTISFDIAGLELYLPLLAGGRVELVSSEVAADGAALAELIETADVSVLQATPATWRMMLHAGWRGRSGLKALCGGEALPTELAEPLLERVGELWNLYGPTETTIWSTVGRVERDRAAISIGRPIDNTRVVILNGDKPCPIGVIGEICIGGDGLANGYLGRPELTAERFVADPVARQPGQRIYRTGDLGRWGSDGRLYHHGRIDQQVKIRGFRVELGEIEGVLNEHPGVRQAIVVTRELGPGDVRLVSYIVYSGPDELTISEIRQYLRSRLPNYMIPALAVPLDAVPLTPSGKVDRKALPDPFDSAVRPSATFEEPSEGLEREIADSWRELLKVDVVGAQDNFFELGGDSLLAVRFVANLGRDTGARLDPRNLFFQNLRQLAATASELLRQEETFSS